MAAPIRVLHVDDDRDLAELTAELLERESERIEIHTATDPTDGLDHLEAADVDCIVSDYDMPEMDGIEFLERVRAVDGDVPFILFTGKGSEEVASDALATGATDYLQKAAGRDQYALLANRVENAVAQQRSVAKLERQGAVLETAQELADLGVCEIDAETGELWLSEGMFSVFDVPRPPDGGDTITGLDHEDIAEFFYHQEDRDAMEGAIRKALETGEQSDLEVRLNTEAERWVRVRCTSTRENGETRKVRAAIQEVTDRKDRERELQQQERRFQAVFEDPDMLVGLLETDGTLLDTNETSLAYVDATLDELRGVPFPETPWWHDDVRPEVRSWVERAADGAYVTYEADLRRPDGEPYCVSGSIRPVTDEAGTVVSLIVSARDVTERRSSRERRAFFQALVEATTDVITVFDDEGRITYHSPAVEDVLGYEQEELLGDAAGTRLHPDDREAVYEWFEQVVDSDRADPGPIEHRVEHADGSWRWLEASPGPRVEGEVDGYVVTSRDVTERKHRERELREYERLIGSLGQTIFTLDEDGDIAHINPAGAPISGYEPEEILERGAELLYDEAEIAKIERAVEDLVEDGDAVVSVETTVETRDGEMVPVENTISAFTDRDGEFAGAIGVAQDVTDRRETERDLREYESIIQALPDEVSILDTDGHFTRIIPSAGEETTAGGYDPDELVGEHVSKAMTDGDMETANALVEELVTTDRERGVFEMQIVTKEGEKLWREDNLALLEDEAGRIHGTVGVLRDIEERKEYERELERQNERLEEFASIASHDLRNPLNVAQGYTDMLAADCESEHVEVVEGALDRMEQLIEDTLTWARQGETVDERVPVALAELVPDCWDAVGGEAGRLEVIDAVTVHGDRSRIRRVLENLLRNAVEHGGTGVTVTVGAIDGGGFYVADDGPGIPAEDRESVFDAGMTTVEEGTGFGLAIIAEIIEAHGWEIAVTESDAGGARFEITT